MELEAVEGASATSDDAAVMRHTQDMLDKAFDEFDVADLLEEHADLVCDMSEKIQQLEQGLESRTVIGKALGICLERYNLDEDQAFQFLVRISQEQNVKLRDVAARLVESTVDQNEDRAVG
jgi:AmiR/NasT family two-component response regulator